MAKKSVTSAAPTTFYITPEPGYLICKGLIEDTVGGFTISDNMSDKDSAGVVIAIGKPLKIWHGAIFETQICPVAIGDKIIYSNYGVQRYMDFQTGKHIFFVKFADIMGVINE